MDIKETVRRLSLFGIPVGDSREVREMLARLVAAESLSLGELQMARDIVGRAGCGSADAYLFLAAMCISARGGNAFLRPGRGAALLENAGYIEDAPEGTATNAEFSAAVRDAWSGAAAAAEELDGDVVVKRSGADGDRWFFRKNLAAVEAVSNALAERAADSGGGRALSPDELAAATGFEGFELNKGQTEAVDRVARKRLTVVTGGPGTGKTTVVCAMLRALMARGLEPDEIALAAPTGRAAQRMGEALRGQCARARCLDPETRKKIESLDGVTIHSLLGGFPPRWKYTKENRLPLGLVVVDESSMVDLHLMKALLAALPPECRLVLLGDKDQLPSVETGAVLGDIVGAEDSDFIVRLTESKRFGAEFARCAGAVNAGDAAEFARAAAAVPSGSGGWLDSFDGAATADRCFRCTLTDGADPSACHARILEWAAHYGLLGGGRLAELASDPCLRDDAALTDGTSSPMSAAIFAELDRSRIMTVVRSGPYGAKSVNELVLRARFGGRLPSNPLAKAGVPVIVTRNTPSRKLWNGDVGVTVERRSGMTVMFPRGDSVV